MLSSSARSGVPLPERMDAFRTAEGSASSQRPHRHLHRRQRRSPRRRRQQQRSLAANRLASHCQVAAGSRPNLSGTVHLLLLNFAHSRLSFFLSGCELVCAHALSARPKDDAAVAKFYRGAKLSPRLDPPPAPSAGDAWTRPEPARPLNYRLISWHANRTLTLKGE